MKQQKQQLKHQHRDRMVEIGIRAVEHVIQGSDSDLRSCLDLIRDRDRGKIAEAIRKLAVVKDTRPVTRETILARGVEALLSLSISDKYISGSILDFVFVPCSNSFVFVSDEAQKQEENWQNINLRPLIDDSFEQLRKAEDQLRREQRKLAA
jgi:hypothetical protein